MVKEQVEVDVKKNEVDATFAAVTAGALAGRIAVAACEANVTFQIWVGSRKSQICGVEGKRALATTSRPLIYLARAVWESDSPVKAFRPLAASGFFSFLKFFCLHIFAISSLFLFFSFGTTFRLTRE